MELRHLRYFVAVADERSFTHAATRLNIAQSPLSQQVRQLEREIGVQLFTRTTRSVRLTYAGTVFYERARRLLEDGETAAEDARKAERGELGALSIGFTGSATYELLPTLVRAYADRYPEVTLRVHSDMVTPQQTEQLLDGRLAVGVLRPPVTVAGLAVETIRQEPVMVLLSSRHPASAAREIDLADLRDQWFVSYPDQPAVDHVLGHAGGLPDSGLHAAHPAVGRRQRRTRRPRRGRHGRGPRPRLATPPPHQRRDLPPLGLAEGHHGSGARLPGTRCRPSGPALSRDRPHRCAKPRCGGAAAAGHS